MRQLKLTVPGVPVAQGRPRACIRGGHAAVYQPKASAEWRSLVSMSAAEAMAGFGSPFDCAVSLQAVFYFPWPKSMTKAARARGEGKSTKPDIDNLLKGVMDGLNGIAWRDDSRVSAVYAAKAYSDTPRTVIAVTALEGMPLQPEGGVRCQG